MATPEPARRDVPLSLVDGTHTLICVTHDERDLIVHALHLRAVLLDHERDFDRACAPRDLARRLDPEEH